MNALN
jgi:hypothetical protein